MSFDENWHRWIRASITKHFNDLRAGVTLYKEGEVRKTNQDAKFYELRINGPRRREIVQDQFRIEVDVDVLINCRQATNPGEDVYLPERLTGKVSAMFTSSIAILKLGADPGDDGSLLACLNLDTSDRGKDVRTTNYGLIKPAQPTILCTVEALYYAYL